MINETLIAAAQYMDEHGKAIGLLEDKGRVCMLGAIWKVADTRESACVAEFHLEMYARAQGLRDEIFTINDSILDTKKETVKFMMEAAEWEPSK